MFAVSRSTSIAHIFLSIFVWLTSISVGHAQIGSLSRKVTMRIDPDMSLTKLQHDVIKPLTPASVQLLSAMQITTLENEEFELVEAYTRKADGRLFRLQERDIVMQSGVAAPLISYTGIKIRQLPFRDVEVGDEIVASYKTVTRDHFIPNHISVGLIAPQNALDTQFELTLEHPKTVRLRHYENQVDHLERERDGLIEHHWTGHWHLPVATEAFITDPYRVFPSLGFSTFDSYEEIASAYYDGAAKKLQASEPIRALAADITRNAMGPREAAQAIFRWVATNIRYVSVYFGAGRFVPNEPEAVVSRRYGDCKDHVALMSALLDAVGISSEQALINAQLLFELPDAPLLQTFNHVIIFIPELNAYADPTSPTGAIGLLPAPDSGKPVLRVGPNGATRDRTPIGSSAEHRLHAETKITLHEDGTSVGQSIVTGTGRFALGIRQFLYSAKGKDAQSVLGPAAKAAGITGSLRIETPATIDDNKAAFIVHWTSDQPFSVLERGFVPRPVLPFPIHPRSFFGTVAISRRQYPVPCLPGEMSSAVEVTLPPTLTVVRAGVPIALEDGLLQYRQRWSLSGSTGQLRTWTKLDAREPVCSAAQFDAVVERIEDLGERGNVRLRFTKAR